MPKRGPRPVPRCWLHFQHRDHPTTKGYKEKRRGESGDIFTPTSRMRRAVSAARTIALLARHPRHNTQGAARLGRPRRDGAPFKVSAPPQESTTLSVRVSSGRR